MDLTDLDIAEAALGHFFEHDLGGASSDGQDAGVPGHAFDRRLAHVAHAAVKLQAVVHDPVDHLSAECLHPGHFADVVLSRVAQPGGVVHRGPDGVHLGLSHGQALAYRPEVGQPATEGFPVGAVGGGQVQGGLGCTLFTVKGRPTVSARAIAWFSIPAWPGVNTQQGIFFVSDDVNLEPI